MGSIGITLLIILATCECNLRVGVALPCIFLRFCVIREYDFHYEVAVRKYDSQPFAFCKIRGRTTRERFLFFR